MSEAELRAEVERLRQDLALSRELVAKATTLLTDQMRLNSQTLTKLAEARDALRALCATVSHMTYSEDHPVRKVRERALTALGADYRRHGPGGIPAAAPAEPKGDSIKAFIEGQQPLGEPFEKVLHDNLSSLIRQSNEPKGDGGHTA